MLPAKVPFCRPALFWNDAVPLILGPDKSRLSKRHGATDVNLYRTEGFLPEAFRNFLALLGWSAGHDEEFLRLIKASGCQGLLIGFESLDPENLRRMRKSFNLMRGGYERALANLRRH